jgi:RNA polymerase sigma-70 factor (sigma-E family)
VDVAGVLSAPATRLESLGAWYENRYPALLRFAYVICRDAAVAEDLVQESFVRIYRAWRKAEEEGLDAYARRTIVNLNHSRFRRLIRERRALSAMEVAPDHREPSHDHEVLWEAMGELTEQQRACVALRYYEGLTESETAQVLGVGVGSVKRHVHRAMEKLRKKVGEDL